MNVRDSVVRNGLAWGLLALLAVGGGVAPAYGQRPKAPQWSYAFDLSCRKFGEQEFTKDTKKYGVEVFRDPNNELGVYLSQVGSVAVTGHFTNVATPLPNSKAPEWFAGLDLKARQAGEQEFTKDTKTYSLEVFLDVNTGHFVYMTEAGKLAIAPGKKDFKAPSSLKAPQWLHSMDLRCRKAGVKEWTKETPAYGIEVYRDGNTGNLIYITDTGSLAVVPGAEAAKDTPGLGKAPEWLHGLDLSCRKYGESDFTKATRKLGVEIFRDMNNGNLVLIEEEGNITVVSGVKASKAPTANPKDAKFAHGLDLSCRQAGERDFTEKTRTFGVEVFREGNLELTIFICETGSLSAIEKK